MEPWVARIVAFIGVAMAVAIVARRLQLPYTVGLVATGLALALSRVDVGLSLTHDVVFDLILPPLLFEAALNLPWRELKREALPVLTLASLGIVLSMAFVAAGLVLWLGWPWQAALTFGALISATDPIAVIALLRESGVKGRLALTIEAESLVNDGAAAALFGLTQIGAGHGLGLLIGGGIGVGALAAGAALLIAGRTDDHLVETALTTVAAYGAFLAAERLGASGVIATITAGLLLGNIGVLAPIEPLGLTVRGREFVLAFWEFAAFLANSFVFLLIGLSLGAVGLALDWRLSAAVILALLGRAVNVYPVALLFARTRWRLSWPEQHFLWWGGLRGALALALALTLPPDTPYRAQILSASFAVVAFSVLVQGLSAGWLLQRLGIRGEADE